MSSTASAIARSLVGIFTAVPSAADGWNFSKTMALNGKFRGLFWHTSRSIPEKAYFEISQLGRAKYRGIVVSTFMALLWDGWTTRKKTKRKPSSDVMVTRRMLAAHFDFSESTAKQALADLTKHGLITVSRKSVHSGKKGNNLGTFYRLPWMEKKPSGKHLKIYWGLLVSDAFLALSVTPQATIILLHKIHNRKKNSITVRPCALESYGIHRTSLYDYFNELRQFGFLINVAPFEYEFGWIDTDGNPDFRRLNKNSRVAN